MRVRRSSPNIPTLLAGFVLLLLQGCAGQLYNPTLSSAPALEWNGGYIPPQEAAATAPTPELLDMDAEMREFVDRYVRPGSARQRLQMLHTAIRSSAMLGIDYDPRADGTAREAFHRGTANCLTYAHLFITLARYANLDARYLSLTLRPEWSRHGEVVALRQHVNVIVNLPSGSRYMVDIDPISRETVATASVLSDREAFALHHGNLSMAALYVDELDDAYAHATRALQLSGGTDYLWVNLGAIHRRSGNHPAAISSYMTALELNDDSRSAMNNLAVVYYSDEEYEKASYWEERVADHRQRNPYYHVWLGEQAETEGDIPSALDHYHRAIELKDSDGEFYYRLALLYQSLQQHTQSLKYAELAVANSRLVGERDRYEALLATLRQPGLASIDR